MKEISWTEIAQIMDWPVQECKKEMEVIAWASVENKENWKAKVDPDEIKRNEPYLNKCVFKIKLELVKLFAFYRQIHFSVNFSPWIFFNR